MGICGISNEQINSLLLTWLLNHKAKKWGDAMIRGNNVPEEPPRYKD